MSRHTRKSRTTRPTSGDAVDPLVLLGLPQGASTEQIELARRTLAKRAHPDVGGSLTAMQRINAAADAALRHVSMTPPAASTPGPAPAPSSDTPPRRPYAPLLNDNPSFTIEALPAEAFEALLIVASALGDTIDDDPPYRLDVAMADPIRVWCRLDLTPEAGASSVGLTVAGEPGAPLPDLDLVRDAWIAELNTLDWSELTALPRQP